MGPPPVAEVLKELRARFHENRQHLQADHIVTIEERRDLRRDLTNMQTLCSSCHSSKTMNESVRPNRATPRTRSMLNAPRTGYNGPMVG